MRKERSANLRTIDALRAGLPPIEERLARELHASNAAACSLRLRLADMTASQQGKIDIETLSTQQPGACQGSCFLGELRKATFTHSYLRKTFFWMSRPLRARSHVRSEPLTRTLRPADCENGSLRAASDHQQRHQQRHFLTRSDNATNNATCATIHHHHRGQASAGFRTARKRLSPACVNFGSSIIFHSPNNSTTDGATTNLNHANRTTLTRGSGPEPAEAPPPPPARTAPPLPAAGCQAPPTTSAGWRCFQTPIAANTTNCRPATTRHLCSWAAHSRLSGRRT